MADTQRARLRGRRARVRRGPRRGRRGSTSSRSVSRTLLFWSAFILTRPLGATVGDLLDKPVTDGGLALSRLYASLLLAAFMVLGILLLPQRAGGHPSDKAT